MLFFYYFNIAELQVISDFSLWLNLKTAELIWSISPIWFCTSSWGPSIPIVCLPSQSLPHSLSLSSLSCLGFDLHFPAQCPALLLESGIQRELLVLFSCLLLQCHSSMLPLLLRYIFFLWLGFFSYPIYCQFLYHLLTSNFLSNLCHRAIFSSLILTHSTSSLVSGLQV